MDQRSHGRNERVALSMTYCIVSPLLAEGSCKTWFEASSTLRFAEEETSEIISSINLVVSFALYRIALSWLFMETTLFKSFIYRLFRFVAYLYVDIRGKEKFPYMRVVLGFAYAHARIMDFLRFFAMDLGILRGNCKRRAPAWSPVPRARWCHASKVLSQINTECVRVRACVRACVVGNTCETSTRRQQSAYLSYAERT